MSNYFENLADAANRDLEVSQEYTTLIEYIKEKLDSVLDQTVYTVTYFPRQEDSPVLEVVILQIKTIRGQTLGTRPVYELKFLAEELTETEREEFFKVELKRLLWCFDVGRQKYSGVKKRV